MTWAPRVTELRAVLVDNAAGQIPDVVDRLEECVEAIGEVGYDLYEDLVDLSSRVSATNMGTPDRWAERCRVAQEQVSRAVAETYAETTLVGGHTLHLDRELNKEIEFYRTLGAVETPRFHDRLIEHQVELNTMLGTYQERWTFLLDRSTGFYDDQKAAMVEVATIAERLAAELDRLPKVVETVAGAVTRVGDKVADAVEKTGGAIEALKELVGRLFGVDIPPEVKPEELVRPATEAARLTEAEVAAHRRLLDQIRELVSLEKGSVLPMFTSTRAQVDAYYAERDLAYAEGLREAATRALNDWAGREPGALGQVATTLARAVLEAGVDRDLAHSRTLDDAFRQRFSGTFLGPLGRQTLDELARTERFRSHLDAVTRHRVDERARQAAERLATGTETEMDRLADRLEDVAGGVDDPETRELLLMRSREFVDDLRKAIQDQLTGLAQNLHAIEDAFAMPRLSDVFNREEFLSELT